MPLEVCNNVQITNEYFQAVKFGITCLNSERKKKLLKIYSHNNSCKFKTCTVKTTCYEQNEIR